MRSTLIPTIAGLLLLIFGGQSARAQTYTVQSISPTPDIGRVVSAASGDTVFRFAASNGAVSKVSGNGVRLDSTTTRATVTIKCSNSSLCPNPVTITVAAAAVTKRARALTNFTVTAGTGMTVGAVTGTGPTVFTLAGIPRNGTGTFHLGADLGIGDDTSGATGATTAAFTVSTPTHSSSASAAANVFRTITIAQNSALGFGRIIRPSTGSNTVTVSESTGARTISGAGNGGLFGGTVTRATYTVSGEGAQAFSISAPTTMTMTRSGGSETITVNLVRSATSGTLSGTVGTAGTASFGVGGNLTVSSSTTPGSYSGTFNVTVQYN